jgi:hypothetical protein
LGLVHEAWLGPHLFQIPIAEAVTEIPADAQQDDLALEAVSLEEAVQYHGLGFL